MKKYLIVPVLLVVLLLLGGCLNYKAYEAPEEPENLDLLNEIAELEEELSLGEVPTVSEGNEGEGTSPEEPEVEGIVMPEVEEEDFSNLQRIEVNENELVDFKVKISDPDKDEVQYSFSLPLNDQGKWKTNYGDAGEYVVTITATDGENEVQQNVLLAVNRVNVPPTIKAVKDILIKEGETVNLEPQVVDPNGDQVTVTLTPPLETGSWTTDHTSAGEYEVTILATDGELENKKTFLLTITDVNVLPELSGLEDLTVTEGETITLTPEVLDLDNDEITLTISNPVGNDGVWETSYTDHGEYVVTVTAFDGKDKVTETVKIVVEDVNMPPEILEITLG